MDELLKLLEKQFITKAEFDVIDKSEFVGGWNCYGESDFFPKYYEYEVQLMDCLKVFNIYVKEF